MLCMDCPRRAMALGIYAGFVTFIAPIRAADSPRDAAFASRLEQLLKTGLHGRLDLSRLNRHAAAARRYRPKDPSVAYAYGLVMLKRARIPQATAKFRVALRKSPIYLPAWRALLRTRLVRKDRKSLLREAKRLADTLSNSRIKWSVGGQNDGAEFLGRIVGFLELPKVDFLSAKELAEFDADLKRRLGTKFGPAYAKGKVKLQSDFRQLQAQVARDLIKEKLKSRRKTDEKLSAIEDRKAAADKKEKNLQLTAAQWKSWIGKQSVTARKRLAELQKDYRALQAADARVSRLSTQTTIEIGRLQTEFAVRGIRGSRADLNPGIRRLRQDSIRYRNQRFALQRRAAGVRLQARGVLAAYAGAARNYRNATGKIVKNDASVKRWQGILRKTSANLKKRQRSKEKANLRKNRLSQVASFFELDFEAETKRLLKPFQPQLKAP